MRDPDIYNAQHFDEIVQRLKQLERCFRNIAETDVVQRISKHDILLRGELQDLSVIWTRFLRDRKELIELAPLTRPYLEGAKDINSEEARLLFQRETALTNSLKVDLKSLFLFADILFNKLALLVRAVYGPTRNIKYESFSSFLKSIRLAEAGGRPERGLYESVGESFERIDVLLGFYRDKFIVHVSGPYQEGVVRAVYLPEIRLDHTSWKLNEFDLESFGRFVDELGDVLPQRDKYGNPLKARADPRLKVETLFLNLHKIRDPNLRQRAEGYIRSVGLSTPDIYYLIKTVKDSVIKTIDHLEQYVRSQYVHE